MKRLFLFSFLMSAVAVGAAVSSMLTGNVNAALTRQNIEMQTRCYEQMKNYLEEREVSHGKNDEQK